MRKAIYIACLILIIVPLAACTAGGGKGPLATFTVVPSTASRTTANNPKTTDTPTPTTAAAYPGAGADDPTTDNGFSYPPAGWPPGPESGYPAEVLTQTAKAPTPTPTQTPKTTIPIPAAPGSPTITLFPVSKTQPELPPPCDVFQGRDSYPTPDLKDLHWEKVLVDGKPFDRLTGLSAPGNPATPSPDGAGVALFITYGLELDKAIGGLLVVDGPGSTPWWAVQSNHVYVISFQWLPGNRLLWIDKGELYSTRADGSHKVNYHAPEPVSQVWSNGSTAMLSGRHHLWLLDLAARTWTMKVENIDSPFASAALTPDGRTLLINNSGELIQAPMDPRGEITRYKPLFFQGSGGVLPPPVAIAGGPYIYPGLMELVGGEDPRLRFVVFKEGVYEPIDLEALIGKSEVHSIYAIDVSPDGNWVLFPFNGSDQSTQETQYLAPANDLQAGRVVMGSTVGWRENPAAVLLTDGEIIRQVSLPSFEEKILGRFPLLNDRPYLAGTTVGPDTTVIRINNRLHLFDALGNLKGQIDLPHHPQQIYSLAADKNDTFYLTGWDGKPNGDVCEATYWMEIIDGGK